jgi:hypothetical protein
MKISLSEDPMVVSNSIKFIYAKYEAVFLFWDRSGLNISYVDWQGERHEENISEIA